VENPQIWQDSQAAKKVMKELSSLKDEQEKWNALQQKIEDTKVLYELAEEEKDKQVSEEADLNLENVRKEIERWELNLLLSGPFDQNSCFLTIHAGAGGTESCDWAQLLLRLYSRWAERNNYSYEIIDSLPGEEAGIKYVTLAFKGEYSYGYLKAERGVHRLVRLSPFDSNHRRHTSFVSVEVLPEISEDIQVEIKESDLKIDTFRASGPGGQHVNVTDSAVRITHLPSGITSQAQSERSQHKNKAQALRVLKARLYQHHQEQVESEKQKLVGEKKQIEWGSQIRSYTLHPYNLVKDHRTGLEESNTNAVLDGDIDPFIESFLRMQAEAKGQ